MNTTVAIGAGIGGALAGIPVAAIAFAVPNEGPIRVPPRWWLGQPASPLLVAVVALLAGTSAALVCGRLPPSAASPAFGLFAVVGLALAIVDIRRHRLPYRLTAVLYVALAAAAIGDAISTERADALLRACLAAALTSAALLVLALAVPGQLGLGDVVLAGAIALSLGWLSWHAMLLGLLSGLVVQAAAVTVNAVRGSSRPAHLPMGPALMTGWLLGVLAATTH